MSKQRVIVGLSGGVDSAVAALRLCEQGYEVEGLFMKNWEDDDTASHCTAEADLADARQICTELGIPLHQVNFAREYRERVFDACLAELRAGRTPNPDTLCNRHIKFGVFLQHALRLGADRVATGHYAATTSQHGSIILCRGADPAKDQSYFLHLLTQQQLARTLFPLADLTKGTVRERAADAGFDNFAKKDSTGVCFIGERDFAAFLQRYITPQPGAIVTREGEVIGEHAGIAFYTIGQRRGLGLGGRRRRASEPWYVLGKDVANNRLVVGQGHEHPELKEDELVASAAHWVDGQGPDSGERLSAQIRYRQRPAPCTVERIGSERLRVVFEQAQWAVTPGQAVVIYDGCACLGGGTIESAFTRAHQQEEAVALE